MREYMILHLITFIVSVIIFHFKTYFIKIHVYIVLFWLFLIVVTFFVILFRTFKYVLKLNNKKYLVLFLMLIILIVYIIYWINYKVILWYLFNILGFLIESTNIFLTEKYNNIIVGLKFMFFGQ